MNTVRITGYVAVEYAIRNDLLLRKHADPIEDARDDVTPEEAHEIAEEDPSLVYLDIPAEEAAKL